MAVQVADAPRRLELVNGFDAEQQSEMVEVWLSPQAMVMRARVGASGRFFPWQNGAANVQLATVTRGG